MEFNTEPTFAPEAQETFVEGCRVFERGIPVSNPVDWPEGTYLGRDTYGQPVVSFDGVGIRTANFQTLRNLYR